MKMLPIETEEEFAELLDNYDITDFWDEFEDVRDKEKEKKRCNLRSSKNLMQFYLL